MRRERLLAIISALAVLFSTMVIFAPAALAHHPEIEAELVCDGELQIVYESVSWRTDGGSGSAHDNIIIEVQVNGSGPWIPVGSGSYNAGNSYRFSDSFDAEPYIGDDIVVRARADGAWTNGQGGGETRQTSVIAVEQLCTETVTVTASPAACAVNQQGQPRGSVSFQIDPNSGATVRVYANSNFTGQIGGALGDGVSLSLAPGTYYWQATASSGYQLSGPSSGSFTIQPCSASAVVVDSDCLVVQGVPQGAVQVTINPTSGATVVVRDSEGDVVATFTGSGGTQSLPPGDYTWTATAATGFNVPQGQGSGSFDVDPCETSVTVVSGGCVVGQNGAPLGSVQVTIDPASGATVTITGPGGPYVFTGSGGTQGLPPGDYSWSAVPGSGFAMTGPTSGQFTVAPCDSSVSVSASGCQLVEGVGVGSATVGISPQSGATVVISGPGGPYVITGAGDTVDLPPGSYSWQATPGTGFTLTGAASGNFTINPCDATVSITGRCLLDGDAGSGLIEVTIEGSATVSIFEGATLVETLSSSGTVLVDEGATYTWSANVGQGSAISGDSEGEITIEACSRSLQIVVNGVCRNDVPYLTWTVTPINFAATETTITWLDIDPGNALHSSVQALSGEMVWPGAVVEGGKAVDWPGWLFVDEVTRLPIPLGTEGGTWIKGEDGFEGTRPETLIQFEVNPTAVVEVDYPGGEPTCAGPPDEVLGEEIDPDDPTVLPFTGFDGGILLGASVLMLGSGTYLVLVARRREEG